MCVFVCEWEEEKVSFDIMTIYKKRSINTKHKNSLKMYKWKAKEMTF